MKNYFSLCLLVFVVSCGRTAKNSIYEVTGDVNQRIAAVKKIISEKSIPPTPITDAFFNDEQVSDNQLGPSDFSIFCVIVIKMEDLQKWRQTVRPMSTMPKYIAPQKSESWWISSNEFSALEFFHVDSLSTRNFGWVGISTNTGTIFIHSETM
jgi:hypothetical protein